MNLQKVKESVPKLLKNVVGVGMAGAKKVLLISFCFLLLISGVVLHSYSKPAKNVANYDDIIAGLLVCVSSNKCLLPSTSEEVSGKKAYGVYLKIPEKEINIKYVFVEGGLFVVVAKDNGNQISLNDFDLDGLVDVAYVTENGAGHFAGDPKYKDEALDVQFLYFSALDKAWELVIPEKIKNALLDHKEDQLDSVGDEKRFKT